MKKDFLSIRDLSVREIEELFALTGRLKKQKSAFSRRLSGKTLALIFQKPSNRTRVSFEVGMHQLGGNAIYLGPDEINLGVREAIKDVARTLSRYVDGIVLRTFAHANVVEMAEYATVPVINGLSDFSHPCQAMADVYTIKENFRNLKKVTLAYVGDGNNVCHSLLLLAAKVGMNIRVASPQGYEPKREVFEEAMSSARKNKSIVQLVDEPLAAVKGAQVIYTDVWTSMGQEVEAKQRLEAFAAFQVNRALLAGAAAGAKVMHCLPAHRGQEITDEVLDGPQAIVFDQAENRLHVQQALLLCLLAGGARRR